MTSPEPARQTSLEVGDQRRPDEGEHPNPAGEHPHPAGEHPHPAGEHPHLEAVVDAIKPHLRGWIHLGTVPLALAAGVVLIVLAPPGRAKIASVVFSASALLLFGTSAIYHRGTWSPKVHGVLKRLDHSNIFLIIAGSYTPFALLLPPDQARSLLLIVWFGALGGVLFRVLWVNAPRWLYTPIYVALGWVAVFYFGPLWRGGGPWIMSLIVAGGLLYTLGAVVYGTKKPDPSPRWFGFHEVFHACTVLAFTAHYIAASMAVYGTSGS